MSNYQEGGHTYPEGSPQSGGGGYAEGEHHTEGRGPYEGAPSYQGGGASSYQGGSAPQGNPYAGGQVQQGGHYYPGGPGAYQETQQFSHHGGSRNPFQGGSGRRRPDVRSTFKTSEFWIFVVTALALLIAAAVTDSGPDNQGFGAEDAWRYVTALAIGYFISRGLTKFGGHEHDCGEHGRHDRH
jgi:hypothetical protein